MSYMQVISWRNFVFDWKFPDYSGVCTSHEWSHYGDVDLLYIPCRFLPESHDSLIWEKECGSGELSFFVDISRKYMLVIDL